MEEQLPARLCEGKISLYLVAVGLAMKDPALADEAHGIGTDIPAGTIGHAGGRPLFRLAPRSTRAYM